MSALPMFDERLATPQNESAGTPVHGEGHLVPVELDDVENPKWELKKLSPKHKDICSLIAQGIGRQQIASLCQITPEYVTMLAKQPLCIAFIRDLNEFAGVQMEAMFVKSVAVIADVMDNGNAQDKLKAARLQMEATGRVGSKGMQGGGGDGMEERLAALAGRLVGLLEQSKGDAIDGQFQRVTTDQEEEKEGGAEGN